MNASADLTTAHALFREKRFAESDAACRKLLETGGRTGSVVHLLALVRKALGDFPEAETLMRESIALDPVRAEYRANLGNLLRNLGRIPEAVEAYREALRLDDAHTPARLGLARSLVDTGLSGDAEAECRKLLARNSRNPEAWSTLARALQGQANFTEAEAAYRQALALAPGYAAAHHNLGALLSRMEQAEAALESLDRAAALGVRTRESYHNRGRVLLQLNRIEEAEQAYAQAVALAPTHIESQMGLANVRHMRGDPHFARDLGAAVKAHPNNEALWMALADVLRRSGDLTSAETMLRHVLSLRGPAPHVRSALATVLLESGDLKDAELHALEAATAQPQEPSIVETLVVVLLAKGRAAEAKAFIETYRKRAPLDQLWIAYSASAARMLGEPLHTELYDYSEFVRSYELRTPTGWSSLTAFLEDLQRVLVARHRLRTHPLEQSLRHGTQTSRSLTTDPDPVIRALLAAFEEPIAAYREAIGVDAQHPLRSRNHGRTALAGCWSVRLHREGFHVNHVHPQGWISSAFYVAVPPETSDLEMRSGWIKFGEPRHPFPGATPEHFVQPKPGRLVLFPSYMWHGTTPIHGEEPRLCVAFDAVPLPAASGVMPAVSR